VSRNRPAGAGAERRIETMIQPCPPSALGDARSNRRSTVLWTIIVILLVLWLLGLIGSIGGGFIHLLLVLAIVVFVAQLLTGRRSV
jgi:K+-transporting ATPase A subunit